MQKYKNIDELPLTLTATNVSDFLGISLANSYKLFHSKEFPSLCIGKRLLIYKSAFLKYLEAPHKYN